MPLIYVGLVCYINSKILCTTDLSLALDGLQINGDAESAAGGKETGYLDLAKKGGGHKGNRHCQQYSFTDSCWQKEQNMLQL